MRSVCFYILLPIVTAFALLSWWLPKIKASTARSQAEVAPNPNVKPQSVTQHAYKQLEYWERQLKRDPFNVIAARKMALAHMSIARATGDESHYREAERILQEAIPKAPKGSTETGGLYARAIMSRHAFKEALAITESLLKLEPGKDFLIELHADACLGLGQYEAAFADFDQLEESFPGFTAFARKAEMLELQGKSDEAMDYLKKAKKEYIGISSEPLSWVLFRMGQNRLKVGSLEEAETYFKASREQTKEFGPPLAPLSEIYELRGDNEKAKTTLLEAIRFNPAPMLFQRLSEIERRFGDTAKAEELSQEALRRAVVRANDGTRGHLRELAEILLSRKEDLPKAMDLVKQDLEMRSGDIRSQFVAARAYRLSGNSSEAKSHIQQALRLGTCDAQFLLEAAQIERELGDTAGAAYNEQAAKKCNPYITFKEAVL